MRKRMRCPKDCRAGASLRRFGVFDGYGHQLTFGVGHRQFQLDGPASNNPPAYHAAPGARRPPLPEAAGARPSSREGLKSLAGLRVLPDGRAITVGAAALQAVRPGLIAKRARLVKLAPP